MSIIFFGHVIYFVDRNGDVVCIMRLLLQAMWHIAKKTKVFFLNIAISSFAGCSYLPLQTL